MLGIISQMLKLNMSFRRITPNPHGIATKLGISKINSKEK